MDTWWEPLAAALRGGRTLLPATDDTLAAIGDVQVADDVALVVPTTGSTGSPRMTMLSAEALTASAHASAARIGTGNWLLALPVTHIAGLNVLIRAMTGGADKPVAVAPGPFTAPAFTAAAASLPAPRFTSVVPLQLTRLLDDAVASAALATFDAVLVGGAATPPALRERASRCGINVVTTYGMSETCGGCVYDGRPLDGVELRIDGSGRIELGGPVVFSGYAGDRQASDEALAVREGMRWHLTRDAGHLGGGRLYVDGRLDDVIISGGENVDPLRVEAALATLPWCASACVVGVPDIDWGQRVVAVVEVTGAPPALAEIRRSLSGLLPAAALPRDVHVVEHLPTRGIGKVDRAAVLDLVRGR